MLNFHVTQQCGAARAATLSLAHGKLDTPVFMPVGTLATVRGVTPEQLRACGVRMLLANTYHLHLRPGEELIADMGGLHDFMCWPMPILTDSGGFQIFSLSNLVDVDERGVLFTSHLDGEKIFLTPESIIRIQEQLGADIIMPLDVCLAPRASTREVREALARTTHWAERSLRVHRTDQALFAIVQGGLEEAARIQSALALLQLPVDGYAIGGLSVGEAPAIRNHILDVTMPVLPWDKPRYLMGVGYPVDLLEGIARGVDMFDCVLPTRNGRNGQAFTGVKAVLNIRNTRFKNDPDPLQKDCACYTCRHYSRAYLRHLFLAKEMLACTLVSIHNIHYYTGLVARARQAILRGEYPAFLAEHGCSAGFSGTLDRRDPS